MKDRFGGSRAALVAALGLVASLGLMAGLPLAAQGRRLAPRSLPGVGTVSFDAAAYTAHEDQGELAITIVKSNPAIDEHVGYGVKQQDGISGVDFLAIPNTLVDIPAGQATYTFYVRILDEGMNATPVHALAYLYTAYPAPLAGVDTNSPITILHDDPIQTRDAGDPLGLPSVLGGNLIAGTRLFVDPNSSAAQAEQRYAQSNPQWAKELAVIADAPGAHRFWMWNLTGNVVGQVAYYLRKTQIEDPGTTVMLSSYNLVHGPCGSTATAAVASRYANFMKQLAAGIGNFHVIYFLELDSLITTPCLSRSELAIREGELRTAVAALEADPHVLVYLDGGAADALPFKREAALLRASGVLKAQGFFLNSTHFDWTNTELAYGAAISKLLGGVHFIINTGENGKGPLRPKNRVKNGNEVLCNPPGRGLGPLSVGPGGVAKPTGYPLADGFLWFTNPGGSGGQCRPGAPPTGTFWPAYAVQLAENWVDYPMGPKTLGSATQSHKRKHKRR